MLVAPRHASYNPRMNVREAKDFLVDQAAQQAAIDGIPLSDLEKRMMYFTEWDDSGGDPIALNDEFEAKYDTAQYEKKISRLMDRAYRRIKTESQDKVRSWNDAFEVLRKGDHYILMLAHQSGSSLITKNWPTYVLAGFTMAGFATLIHFVFGSGRNRRHGEPAPIDRYIASPGPAVQHALQILFLILVVLAIFPQLFFKVLDWCKLIFSNKSARK